MTKAKAITNNIVKDEGIQKMLFRVLLISSIVLCLAYVYLIGSITFNIVARKSLENTFTALSSKVNNLEISYINSINKTDKAYALSQGFVDIKDNIFASRDVNHVAIR